MYLFWFIEFFWDFLCVSLDFIGNMANIAIDIIDSFTTMISSFPLWISLPFGALLAIAIIFRISQFIPTIGGAS